MRRILCLWLRNWPIQRRLRALEGSAARPGSIALALVETGPRGALQVAYVSPAAARLGLRPGTSAADARARRPRGVRWETSDPAGDREELAELARRLSRFSPTAALEESERPESVFLDVSGVCALFGGEGALADAAVRAVEGEGLRCRAAVADTAGAAWAGAHFASVGAGRAVLAPTGGSAAFLAPLPTAALRLRRPTLEALAEFGLKTVGDVLALPRRSLASRLGTEILLRLRQALGEEAEPLAAVAPAQTFVASWDFEQAIERGEVLESVLGRLCESLADELIRAGRGAGRLDCTLRCESSAPIVLTVGLFEPAAHAGHFLELLRLRLERRPLPGGVLGVRLEAGFTRALWSRPGNLFSESAGGDAKELAVLINRVAGRLGGDAVVRLHPRAEAQPELSWREAPLAAGGERKGRRAAPPCAARAFGLLERPLLLFDPPPAVEVACAPPDGPPDRFLWNGVSHRIARRVGPERIETGWWRGRGVRRDYYRVETDQGRRFWLYRSLRSGRWRLHGEFG